jgi:hypothetical protein
MTMDPAPRARQGLAIKEFDDWFEDARKEKRAVTPDEVAKKADDIVKWHAQVDMNRLAERTSIGARNDPERVLEQVRQQAVALTKRREEGSVTLSEYNRQMHDLNLTRRAAELAVLKRSK